MTDLLAEWSEPLATAAVVFFACALGANIGSFLNVVMYRAPRGESVARGGSRCPACGCPVRWRDNVPVFGWLVLGGRCRDCRSPIASRYPLVEAAAALVGLVVAVELLAGGRLMPGTRFQGVRTGADALLMRPDWSFVAVCVVHGAMLMLLLTWSIAETDGFVIPRRWFVAAVLGLGGSAVAFGGPTVAAGWPALEAASLGALAGGLVAALVPNRWLRESLVIAGVVLGWQAVVTAVALMPAAAVLRGLAVRAAGGHPAGGPCVLDLCTAVAGFLLAWRWLALVWE